MQLECKRKSSVARRAYTDRECVLYAKCIAYVCLRLKRLVYGSNHRMRANYAKHKTRWDFSMKHTHTHTNCQCKCRTIFIMFYMYRFMIIVCGEDESGDLFSSSIPKATDHFTKCELSSNIDDDSTTRVAISTLIGSPKMMTPWSPSDLDNHAAAAAHLIYILLHAYLHVWLSLTTANIFWPC